MRVLVLGGTNFIGPYVVRGLAQRGHDVTIFHRGETEVDLPSDVCHVHGDFASFANYVDALRTLSPEVVLDMVPFREEDVERLKAFKGVARRVVAISSGDVYRAFGRIWRTEPGPPDPIPLTEDSPLREKLSNAGLDYNKTAVERGIMGDQDLIATIVRAPATHGPGDFRHRLYQYIKRMDDGRPAILLEKDLASWQWARGYVEDVAHAIVLTVTDERAAGRIYNVANLTAFTESEWVRQIASVVGWQGNVIAASMEQLPANLHHVFDLQQQYAVDSGRIRGELGYAEITSFDEALRRTIEWERANPPEETDPAQFDYAAEDAALAKL
ncbi:MAG TPA: NAD-dependent epimerase/dehydratase family protein, partial [Pyrinomonadaceae bacterium]|nr:NAD-dependent epimerase/dehydratase family protein [Pyrinomonadaceae bacterium]